VRASITAVAIALITTTGCGADDRPPASPGIVTIVQDDAELLHRSAGRIAGTLDDLRDSGVDWVRVTAGWSVIAPAPLATRRPTFDAADPEAYPAGAWRSLDRVYAMARRRGMRTAIDIAFWAPRWAVARSTRRNDRERDTISTEAYTDFAQAVARRYPRAVAFTVWNEPNHNAFLLPQWERTAEGWQPSSPHLYRAMVQSAVPAIKAVAPNAIVLIGATSSIGSERGDEPADRMAPLTFLREMACVDKQLRPLLRAECRSFSALPGDGWSHHPYSLQFAPWQHDPRADNVRMGDLDRLTSLLARLHAGGRTARSLPLYLTESGYQTAPPDPTQIVSLVDQARWLPEAEQIARRQRSLRSVAQFLVRDLPERPGRGLRQRWGDYQSGLRFADGRPKPAHSSFSLGLVARRDGARRVRFWGLVRPGSGNRPARISVLEREDEWRQIARLRTSTNGTFEIVVNVDPQRTFRLESNGRQGAPVNGAR
jgi:hypothetical protein